MVLNGTPQRLTTCAARFPYVLFGDIPIGLLFLTVDFQKFSVCSGRQSFTGHEWQTLSAIGWL